MEIPWFPELETVVVFNKIPQFRNLETMVSSVVVCNQRESTVFSGKYSVPGYFTIPYFHFSETMVSGSKKTVL